MGFLYTGFFVGVMDFFWTELTEFTEFTEFLLGCAWVAEFC